MGAVQSIRVPPISCPLDEPTQTGESSVWRSLHCFDENGGELESVMRSQPEVHTAIGLLKGTSLRHPDVKTCGERFQNPDGTAGPYIFITYKQYYERSLAFGRGLLELGLTRGSFLGIYSQNQAWWQIVAFGAYSVGMAVVPIYDSLGPDAARYITDHAEISAIFCSDFKLPNALNIASSSPNLRYLIVGSNAIQNFVISLAAKENTLSEDTSLETAFPSTKTKVIRASEVEKMGNKSNHPNEFSKPDDIAMIMYTSGTTGKPKGCVLLQRNLVAGAAGFSNCNLSGSPKDLFLSFLPLAHVYAYISEVMFVAQGIRIAYGRGPVLFVVDDIRELQPTVVSFVPRVLNRIRDVMIEQINHQPKPIATLIKWAIHQKFECMKQNKPHSLLLDTILFPKFRAALGGKLRVIVSGGAPLMPEVLEFICGAVSPNLIQGYGMTEGTGGISVQELPAGEPNLLPISPCVDAKLAPVEGNDDYDPLGDPPTGELLLRGPTIFAGYYKDPELTKAAFSEDGQWYKTGDVIRIVKGQMQIIDRAKQLVKLSQGEYISLSLLTEYYSRAEGVAFVYIFASAQHDRPVALVVPTAKKIEEWKKIGIKEIKEDKRVKEFIVKSLEEQFKIRKMRGFEKITHVLIDTVEPSIENGLLTPSMKPQMKVIRAKYDKALETLYTQFPVDCSHESSSS